MQTTISVIIPVYNGGRFLAEAIESVLAQDLVPNEILVVDDGSTDDSLAVAQGFEPRICIVSQSNAGVAAARNTGLDHASGEFVAFLDADDLMLPRRLAAQAAAMALPSQPDVVLSAHWLFRHGEVSRPTHDPMDVRQHMRSGPVPSTAFVRRSAFSAYGRFSVEQRVGDFIEWLSRAVAMGCGIETLPEPLVLRRIHDANLSNTGRTEYANLVHAIRNRRRPT
jgi:glycosyltransferase involved in cell wall biosynthesis